MCLAIPGMVIKIEADTATVDYGGVTKEAGATLFPDLAVGSRVLVHAGFVISVLPEEEGLELARLVEETLGAGRE